MNDNVPGFNFRMPQFQPPAHVTSIQQNLAEEFVKRLITMINDYNQRLGDSEQVALSLVQFGQTMTFSVENIGYFNPSLIVFYGRNADGSPIELIQHISQISCLLTSVPREQRSEPKRQIGFRPSDEVAASKE